MRSPLSRTFFRLDAMDARSTTSHQLVQSKLLVGSDPRCDIVLNIRGVSPQHCYIFVGIESLKILDLATTNGTFVNGRRVREAEVFAGDTLTISDLAFNLTSFEDQALAWIDREAEVAQLVDAVSADAPILIPDRAGLTLIDQEYCDLSLTVSDEDLVVEPPFYVYGDEAIESLDSTAEPLDLEENRAEVRLEVIVYSSGQVIDVQFVDISKHDVILSPAVAKNKIWFPDIQEDITLVQHTKGRWDLKQPEGFIASRELELNRKNLFLTYGVHQVSLRIVEQSFRMRPAPFMWRDRLFYKEASKVAASVFIPFLILLFITFPDKVPEEVKQITIVYKAVQKSDSDSQVQISATEVNSKTENTGQKTQEQPKAQPQMAAAASAAPAKTQESQAPAAAPAAKPMAYKFKSSVSLDSVVADTAPAEATDAGRSPAAVNKAMGTSSSALSGTAAGTSMGVGKLGSDASGSAANSAGAKGLVSKKGFDHSYLEPKTVVLGSMDPELLRKILQEYLPQFRHCYQQELLTAADIKGVIDLDFQINPNGRVSRTTIKAKDARFSNKGTDCMAQVLRIIEFPKPKGGGVVDVRQPLNFFAETEKI
jgi:Sec-independent protein translocase protein TatA